MTDAADIDVVREHQENMTLVVRVVRQGEWRWRCRVALAVMTVAVWVIDKVIRPFNAVIEVE